jgi:glycosyltransferase involved in cell wall biosynthesis
MDGQTILCIATRVWDSLWRDSQQIMSRISARNRVLYFEPGRNPDQPHGAEMWRNWPNFFASRSHALHKNLIVIPTPACLPYASQNLPHWALQITTPWVAITNARILIRHVRQAMRKFDVQNPILWLYEPRHIDLSGKFGEKLVCYYNYDEMSEFARNTQIKALLRHYDNRLSARADVIFATSRGQTERRKKLNPQTYFVPNGVDFNLFNTALDPETSVASEVADLRRPIIGFVGWIGYQIDALLLLRVARSFPDCSIVLVGPDRLTDKESQRQLHTMPNVFFLGQKELRSLPTYLKAINVALIPYLIGGHTLTVYPLKLHEYLAAGRAVVATALPELRPFGQVIRIAQTHEEFIDHVRGALRDNAADRVAERVAVARKNTWDQRVEMIYRALGNHPKLRRDNQLPEPLGSLAMFYSGEQNN